jgi:hypothetical protein
MRILPLHCSIPQAQAKTPARGASRKAQANAAAVVLRTDRSPEWCAPAPEPQRVWRIEVNGRRPHPRGSLGMGPTRPATLPGEARSTDDGRTIAPDAIGDAYGTVCV